MLLRCLPIGLALLLAASVAHAKPPRSVAVQGASGEQREPRRGAGGKATTRKTKNPSAPASSKAARPKPAKQADSVGPPNDGKLVGGVRLDTKNPHLRVVPMYRGDDVRWGLPALVSMVERAAAGVAKRYPGSVLEVGDLSRRNGGEVERHHSHETGRDVDLGFYVVDAKGRPVHARRFQKIDRSLRSTTVPGARFDVARNWALIEMLITDPSARVSHVLVADHLRDALLAYARRHVSGALYRRAALTLMQPTQPLPHDDHMHVRISCPPDGRDHCVELARGAPSKARAAKRRAGERAARAGKPRGSSSKPRERTSSGASRTAETRPAPSPAGPRAGSARRTQFLEAEADATEVRDALDETGLVRITH